MKQPVLIGHSLAESLSALRADRRRPISSALSSLRTVEQLLADYPPARQMELASDEESCIKGDYPTLVELRDLGERSAVCWLIPQLVDLSEYAGVKDKIGGHVLAECASMIARDFHYLKISELMLFFQRFKAGMYGRFYGAVDPIAIMIALRQFVRERNNAIAQYEQEEWKREKAAHDREAITYEEYQQLKNQRL